MVYKMDFEVDGGCRGNGYAGPVAAAAAVMRLRGCRYKAWTKVLPDYPFTPTNQRAELTAIILAMEQAPERSEELHSNPLLDVTIRSDSRYAVNCMNVWLYKWLQNGWINAAGNPVVNQDLIQEASDLEDRLRELGTVEFIWIPREENELADRLCNEAMDDAY